MTTAALLDMEEMCSVTVFSSFFISLPLPPSLLLLPSSPSPPLPPLSFLSCVYVWGMYNYDVACVGGHTHMYMYVPMETQGCHRESSLLARHYIYGGRGSHCGCNSPLWHHRRDTIYMVSGSPALANELSTPLFTTFLTL